MEIQEVFLIFGEKCQELQDAGHHCFFDFSGHVRLYSFRVYNGRWTETKKPVIDEYCNSFRDLSEFVETCFHQANLLMHRPEDLQILPPQSQRKKIITQK